MTTQTNPVAMAELSKATAEAVKTAIDEKVDINHFRPYDSSLPVPSLDGYRTVKCLYKTPKGKAKPEFDNSYIRVPNYITADAVKEQYASFAPFFIAYLQEQENQLIKEKHKAGATSIDPVSLNLAAILEHLEATTAGNRLNGEAIAAWFIENMQDSLMLAFADKLGIKEDPTEAELQKLQAILSTYEQKYKSLASGKTAYRPEEAELLQKALEVTGADKTLIGGRFHARLENMKTATPDDLLLAL